MLDRRLDYRSNSKLQPVVSDAPRPPGVQWRPGSPIPNDTPSSTPPVPETDEKPLPDTPTEPIEESPGSPSGESEIDLGTSATDASNKPPPLSTVRKEHKAPVGKTVAKKLAGSVGKSHSKIRAPDISEPHVEEEVVVPRTEDTHYPKVPLVTGDDVSESPYYRTPPLDYQRSPAPDSSPGASYIDMSDPGHNRYHHKPSGSFDSATRFWKSSLAGGKGQGKANDSAATRADSPHRSTSLRAKLGVRASPRPSLNRSHTIHPSLDLKRPSNSARGSSTPSTRPADGMLPADPFARSPPPLYKESMPSQENVAAIDAHNVRRPRITPELSSNVDPGLFPQDRKKDHARGDAHSLGVPEKPIRPTISRPTEFVKLAVPAHIKEQLEREVSFVKSNIDRDAKKADRGKQKASHEKTVAEEKPLKTGKETRHPSKEGVKRREKVEKGHSKQASAETKRQHSPPTTPKKKVVDPKGSPTPKVHISGPQKPAKDRNNIPPPLALQHDNFCASAGHPHGTASSSEQTLDPGDTVVIQPFTVTPPRPPRPLTPEVGVEGAMCLTMDDFDFESEVEKPPPLPPKDRVKLASSESTTTSSKEAKASEPFRLEHFLGLQRRKSLESMTTGSIYSQSSYCEDDELDLVITPRGFTGEN